MEILDTIATFALVSAAMRRDTRDAQVVQLRRLLDKLREEGATLVECARVAREIDRLQKDKEE